MAIKPITETLQHVRGGMLIIEASEQLAEVVRAVETTGKAGEIDDAVKQILSDIEANIEVPVLYGEIFE